jgi:hypothetical protein
MKSNSGSGTDADGGSESAGEHKSVYEAIFREMKDAVFLIDSPTSETTPHISNGPASQKTNCADRRRVNSSVTTRARLSKKTIAGV